MFLHIFQYDIQLFHHSFVLFDGHVQFSSITGLQLVPGMEKSLVLFEQPSALRKVASFVCKLFLHNTSYLVQYNNAGARKDFFPGHCYFSKIEKFTNEHYEVGEYSREFLKLLCQEKVGEICSFCCKPIPDHSCLPKYHYLSYQKTPKRRA